MTSRGDEFRVEAKPKDKKRRRGGYQPKTIYRLAAMAGDDAEADGRKHGNGGEEQYRNVTAHEYL